MRRPLFTALSCGILKFTYWLSSSPGKRKKLLKAGVLCLTGILFLEFSGICRYTDGYGNFTYIRYPFRYIMAAMFFPPVLLIMSFTLRAFVRVRAYTLITMISVFITLFILVFLIVGWGIFPENFYDTGIIRPADRKLFDSLFIPAFFGFFIALCAPELMKGGEDGE